MQKTIKFNKLNIFLHCLALVRGQAAERTYIAEYTYDENGIKTSVKAEGKTTYFIYEGNTLLGQYTDNDGSIENAMQFLYDENGEIQGVQHNGRMYYYQKDIMGNVYTVRNESGGSSGAYKYEAYGHNFFGYDGNDPFRNINPIKYRGYYYDSYYGGYYNLSRYYNPGMGRFLNLDDPMIALQSKSDPDGMNLYAYCNNDPVNNVDYDGYKYSPSKACKYAKRWWDDRNPNYKTNRKDCANFVSQCLYAGGFSKMTGKFGSSKGWHHYKRTIIGLPTYGGYNPINVFQISDAWGIALNLAEWLYNKVGKSNVVFFRKNDKNIVKKFNDVGKKLKSKGQCTAVAFLRYSSKDENGKWVSCRHIVITGIVDYNEKRKYKYKIYLYGHTKDSYGNNTTHSSLDEFFNRKDYRNQSINLYYLV